MSKSSFGGLTFLVMMKLVPIAMELAMARAKPMYLSSTMPVVIDQIRSKISSKKVAKSASESRSAVALSYDAGWDGIQPRE